MWPFWIAEVCLNFIYFQIQWLKTISSGSSDNSPRSIFFSFLLAHLCKVPYTMHGLQELPVPFSNEQGTLDS